MRKSWIGLGSSERMASIELDSIFSQKQESKKRNDTKPRIPFVVTDDDGALWASGNLYEEGNIQVLWRKDIGFCGQQFSNISYAFDLFPDANTVTINKQRK